MFNTLEDPGSGHHAESIGDRLASDGLPVPQVFVGLLYIIKIVSREALVARESCCPTRVIIVSIKLCRRHRAGAQYQTASGSAGGSNWPVGSGVWRLTLLKVTPLNVTFSENLAFGNCGESVVARLVFAQSRAEANRRSRRARKDQS